MIITNFFDKTFCVNLDRRLDRWEECLFEFIGLPLLTEKIYHKLTLDL